MMRLRRRTSLLVAFSLLTSAATAYADCAWVLWNSIEARGYQQAKWTHQLVLAFTSKEECDRTLEVTRAENPEGLQHHDEGRVTTSALYRCLPDTVDPRGPKGK